MSQIMEADRLRIVPSSNMRLIQETSAMLALILSESPIAGLHSARLLRAENLARVHNTVRIKCPLDSFH
jgi:hypothetical protein